MEKEDRDEANPDKAGLVHGRVEHKVQLRLSALPAMTRFSDFVEGSQAAKLTSPDPADNTAMMQWGFNMLKRRKRRKFDAEELVPISNALYALSKLFSGAGDHKRYYLNESDLIKGAVG
jgi:hypothetical protein